jgi:16S rRNA (adenine1518-N6/adenine1519-N6)-dimethyltransferase
LGQNFLTDPNLARAIVADAGIGPGDRVVEVGAGLGSLTVALADLGADVLAIELDRRLIPALEEVLAGRPNVRVVVADALRVDWPDVLGPGPWTMASNLPYSVAVPVVMSLLDHAPEVLRLIVTVQREVGERLAARPGGSAYGAVSVRVAYHCEAEVLRRVPPSVFWPEPNVESVVVRLIRRDAPPVDVPAERLFRVVEEGFAQRRKTMANAVVRLGSTRGHAAALLDRCGIDPRARAESLSIDEFACLARGVS